MLAVSGRVAQLHSAVSQVCHPQTRGKELPPKWPSLAECNSAIQQITNLRYQKMPQPDFGSWD
jgi:hypothetical protein